MEDKTGGPAGEPAASGGNFLHWKERTTVILASRSAGSFVAGDPSAATSWNVEIYLQGGRVLQARASGRDSREAVETALGRKEVRPTEVQGIAAVLSTNERTA